MLTVSFWTSLTGLMEPIFVPEYWNPPSLFNLAQTTGFDIESLLFSFGMGGLAVVLYERFFGTNHGIISSEERHRVHRHRLHLWVILSFPLAFVLLFTFTNLNAIYSTIIALLVGGIFTLYCRPDLKNKMLVSGLIFLGFYFVYFLTLILLYPGYVEKVWNFEAISGILIVGVPLEELMFALAFGFFWSGVYEHFTWRKLQETARI